MKRMPEVRGVMTPFPYFIDADATAMQATEMMEQHEIRHLPVTRDEKIVGVLSERDLRVVDSAFASDWGQIPVRLLCTPQPYVVEHTERVDIVAREMALRSVGSAIVVKGEKLVGVLTTTDVCHLLADTLQDYYGPKSGTDAA